MLVSDQEAQTKHKYSSEYRERKTDKKYSEYGDS